MKKAVPGFIPGATGRKESSSLEGPVWGFLFGAAGSAPDRPGAGLVLVQKELRSLRQIRSGPGAHFLFVRFARVSVMAGKAEVIQKMVEPVINALGYQLWGIEYLGQGRHTLLRIFIDKEGGINVEDCAEASRQVSSILDVEDPIKDEYTLEVSSPGLDRTLFKPEQYQIYTGSKIKVRLAANAGGRRNFTGTLQEVTGNDENVEIVVKAGEEELKFPFRMIEKASLVIED